jgi:hypothetical protein
VNIESWIHTALEELINWITPEPSASTVKSTPETNGVSLTVSQPLVYAGMTESQLVEIVVGIINAHTIDYDNGNSHFAKPTAAQVQTSAEQIVASALARGVTLPFFLACICEESLFCLDCYDKNNQTTWEGTDWGPCQFSGYEIPTLSGMAGLTQAEMQAKAEDPTYAYPECAVWYAGLLTWAVQPATQALVKANPKAANKYWLATLAYNAGENGAVTAITNGTVPAHPDNVATYCNQFCETFGVPALMP